MDLADATALIAAAVPHAAERWADLGAGSGTFTAALASLLAPGATIDAIDRDPSAVRSLARLAAATHGVAIRPRLGDIDDPALDLPELDGILLANALHFVPAARQAALLARLADRLAPGGRLLVVEYDGRAASRWVPAPVPPTRLREIIPSTLDAPTIIATRPSAYGGAIYAAVSSARRTRSANSSGVNGF